MLHTNKNPNNTNFNFNSNSNSNSNSNCFRSLLAFKPRPVLLSYHNNNNNPTTPPITTASASMDAKITPGMKEALHGIILDFFLRNGFSKTLKRFHSEAQIQTDAWKASSLHLEDMFCKHNASNVDSSKNTSKKPGNDEPMENEKVHPTNEGTTTKKKKKKVIVSSDDCAIKEQPEVTDKKKKRSGKNSGQLSTDNIVKEPETQPIKEKTKHDLVSSTDDAVNESKIDDFTKKTKDKKKKNIEKVKLEPCTTNEVEAVTEVAQKDEKKKKKPSTNESLNVQPDVTEEEKKSSKKRKRSFSDEDENEKKTQTLKGKKSRKEEVNDTETSNKQFDGESNEKDKIDGVKSKKKQSNATVEPKTDSVFQRVKIDEVEFAHDKLQDNSYWAKGGAEIGYGAKAQEVLGQVRGRDFQHEKTKKKRGSYRGGLIDQQSHSIKFNYSDEE